MQITADEGQHGQRLDTLVASAMPRLSRAFVQKLCADGRVLVNGQSAKSGYKVRSGETISVDYDETELDNLPNIDLPIIYEDDDCIAINKPPGVLTHALNLHGGEPSVASFLREKVAGLNGERAGIVHRLDRATSGVIIGAKNQAALSWLQKQFSLRKVKKTYLAIAQGHPKQQEALIDMPIERNPKAPATFRTGPNGKPAITHYKVLRKGRTLAQIELRPETGRTHQLRVHLAKIGTPIVGDPLYGHGKYGERLYLHAKSLEITLPGGQRKTFTAPVPDEFDRLMAVDQKALP